MTTYRLHYFNIKGRAELSRMLLTLAGVEFEDVRYAFEPAKTTGPDFEPLKTSGKLPFGQVPALEIIRGGQSTFIAQSHSIERYISGLFGFLGTSPEESGLIDSICEGFGDVYQAYSTANRKKNEDKGVALNEFYTSTFPKWLAFFNNFVQKNEDRPHLVGASLSYADVAFFGLTEAFENPQAVNEQIEKFPSLVNVRENVRGLLSDYISKRPNTPF